MKKVVDASQDVRAAIADIYATLRRIEAKVDRMRSVAAPDAALSDLRTEIQKVARRPITLDFRDVFRPSGPAHMLGYVPDPGAAEWDERALMETGWGFPLRGMVRPVTVNGLLGEEQLAGDILNILASVAITGNLGVYKIYAQDIEIMGEAKIRTLTTPW